MPSLISFLNIFLAILLLFIPLWFSRRYLMLPYLNPLTIIMLATFPVEIMVMFIGPLFYEIDLVNNFSYQYALLANNTFIFFQALSLVIFFKIFKSYRVDRFMPYRRSVLSKLDLLHANWIFIGLFLTTIFFLASIEYGVYNWISNPRVGYQAYRTGYGFLYALAMSFLSISVILTCLRKPTPFRLILVLILYIPFAYLLGTKGAFLNLFITVSIMLWFTRWRYLSLFMLVGLVLIFLLMLFNLYMSQSGDLNIIKIGAYFDHYRNAVDYYNGYLSNEIELFYGDVFTTSYYSYVPRAIWPDKPYAYGPVLINEVFFPGAAAKTNTPAFGGAVPEFLDFGWIGIVFYGFFSVKSMLTALFSYLIFKTSIVNFHRPSILMIMLLIMQFSQGFGTFFPGFLYVLLVMIVITTLNFIRRAKV